MTKHDAVMTILTAIVDSVKEAGTLGAPAGVLYAALMAQGCTLDQFTNIMSALVAAKKLRKSGDLYFAL